MPGGDGSVATQPGLFVSWSTNPPTIPGAASSTVQITRAFFQLRSLRLIGDSSDDSDTEIDESSLLWSGSGAPSTSPFPKAPPGLYSQITTDIDGKSGDDSYEIEGTVMLSDAPYDFDIYDHAELDINVPFGFTLLAGAQLDAALEIDLATALGVVDFATCETQDGKKVLDTDDAQMPAFRTALQQAFIVAGGEGH